MRNELELVMLRIIQQVQYILPLPNTLKGNRWCPRCREILTREEVTKYMRCAYCGTDLRQMQNPRWDMNLRNTIDDFIATIKPIICPYCGHNFDPLVSLRYYAEGIEKSIVCPVNRCKRTFTPESREV